LSVSGRLTLLAFFSAMMLTRRDAVLFLLQVTCVAAQAPNSRYEYGTEYVYAKKDAKTEALPTVADKAVQHATWGQGQGNGLCVTGREQSPINIVTQQTVKTTMPVIQTRLAGTLQYVKNTGHGFQLFEMSPDEYIYDPAQPSKTKPVSLGKKQDGTVWVPQTTKGYSMIGGSKYDFFSSELAHALREHH